ncbi:16S rRNA (cytosine(1402)-N(4))-methyltransferase RsmH [Metamycoplasma faucium]|uniref:16S rRNA (cytosine(1402)-N(4))-methyltransferase RsmH n=1 Tax=Metamycoplasma faucium TaxID=56142 RepID=UPI00386E39D0
MEKHIPVLLDEVIEKLQIKENGIYVDLTLGRAGHSKEILKKLTTGKLICLDKDIEAINQSNEILKKINSNYVLIKSDFRFLSDVLKKINIEKVDGIIADLGVSSPQLDNVNRGFSYSQNSDLDMRMDIDQSLTAKYILNNYSFETLNKLLIDNADVKFSQRIAKEIIKNRPFNESFELVDLLKNILPAKLLKQKNPAKQVFQALRIAVNDELNAINDLLKQIPNLLNKNGKFLAISFHSKEDYLIKKFYQNLTYRNPKLDKLPIQEERSWSQKIIFPSEKEKQLNKRSHSAKLRIITKL